MRWLRYENIIQNEDESLTKQIPNIKKKIDDHFGELWRNHRSMILKSPDSKMQLFAQIIGDKFQRSPHIDQIQNYKIRNSVTRFRLSAHNLPIETMRYINVPRNLRLCPFCCSSIGDEKHFFLDCQFSEIAESRKRLPSIQTKKSYNDMLKLLKETDPVILGDVSKHYP